MYRIASTIIHFTYFEHLRSLNVANFFFCTVQNHVWPSLLGSQERTMCVLSLPVKNCPTIGEIFTKHPQVSKSDVQNPADRTFIDQCLETSWNIYSFHQLPILFWLSSVEHSENQTNDSDQLQFALQSEWSWWKWLQRKYLSHTDFYSHIFQAGYGCNKELPCMVGK